MQRIYTVAELKEMGFAAFDEAALRSLPRVQMEKIPIDMQELNKSVRENRALSANSLVDSKR